MKNIIRNSTKLLTFLFGVAITMVSCEYQKIADADYPVQKIYMPAATYGIFYINNISKRIGEVPTAGQPYRYVVDLAGQKFNVPLSIYRSGINNDGGFKVDIAVNTDTITKLITAGKLPGAEILPSDKFSIPSSVDMLDGSEISTFNLGVDLNLLRNNYPGKIYALGVGISSTQRPSNPKLSTTIVVIDTKIMKSTVNFSFSVSPTNSKNIIFKNTSLYSVSYSWDFGDGSAASTVTSPSYTYASAGTYTVTLSAIGITGDADKSTITTMIMIP